MINGDFKSEELTESLKTKVLKTFAVFDTDGSKEIDKTEAVNHWKNKFGKLSAKEFFNQVDSDGNGTIEEDEFLRFWMIAKAYGVTEEEIELELENIADGETWAAFTEMPNLAKNVTEKMIKSKGSIDE
mmetsp:Transcript_18871/g.21621  ORF Transcript_18871/g.21621 Transcript_18871/m.21621 type:complete len:129 (+) Transcript_18871:77-463(+)|eukprot:CAMPEP_0194149878 /NCGR_PEP_ID=MMETSP0152-20130528/40389_1 /TAXON_ID=1049557 /ORGANISM="Thalassiothrix antarctica, Strain L6-D1" /LENGTH=128 /DNA_ID=CAMNT_0038852389 /DNA_START=77 /DNA_END=463 /DNA_ORIENTATION=-